MKSKRSFFALLPFVFALLLPVLFSAPVRAAGDVAINSANFPDSNFRSFVSATYDTNGDGILSQSEAAVTSMAVGGKSISNLKGIEYFTALRSLNCSYNSLTSLDVSHNTNLVFLRCNNNQLTSLILTANTLLQELYCDNNKITILDFSANPALGCLNCSYNSLTSLNVRHNANLTDLNCIVNGLTSLDLSGATELRSLSCSINELTSLDLSHNTKLFEMACSYNLLTDLDISHNPQMESLSCSNNRLTSLDLSGFQALKVLDCSNNPVLTHVRCFNCSLIYLDVTNCPKLSLLNCHGNQLEGLDLQGDTALTELYCQENRLTSLDVSALTSLECLDCETNLIGSLNVTNNTLLRNLWCNNNLLTSLDVTKNTGLTILNCRRNYLLSLNVSRNTALNLLQCGGNMLKSLQVGNCTELTFLACENNDLTELNVTRNTVLERLYCYGNDLELLAINKCPNLMTAYTGGTRSQNTDDLGLAYVQYLSADYCLRTDSQTAVRTGEWVQINGMTLELEGKLGIHFFFTPPESAATARLVFHGQKTSTLNFELIRDKAHGYNADTGRFKLSYKNVAMKEMTCPVTLTVSYANGAPMEMLRNGYPAQGNALDFCVADWCNLTISGSGSQKSIDLAKALLRFGGAAQEYFNFNLNNHANPNDYLATEAAAVTADTSLNRVVPTGAQEATGYQNFSLNLEGNTEIRINFSKKVTAKDGNGKAYTVVKVSDNKYYVSIPDIAAVDLNKMFTVKVPASGKTYTFKFAALSWANAVINSSNAAQKNLARALYLYNRYAEAYFN